jgi:hypothetical protein
MSANAPKLHRILLFRIRPKQSPFTAAATLVKRPRSCADSYHPLRQRQMDYAEDDEDIAMDDEIDVDQRDVYEAEVSDEELQHVLVSPPRSRDRIHEFRGPAIR